MGIGVKVAQGCLVAFNFIFVLIGLAGIIAGVIIRIKYDDYINLTSKNIGGVSILMIVLGGIIFVIAFLGCCGALKKSTIMLTIFIVLLVLVLIVEIAGAITAYVFKSKLKGYVEDGMENAMKHYNETKYKDAFDTVQKELKCCGSKNASDWEAIVHVPVPTSCCVDKSKCNSTIATPKYYHEGCADALFDYLKDHLAVVGGLAVAVAVVQIIGIVFACVVRRDVKAGYGYV